METEKKRWYVVHAYSNYEKKVKEALIESVNRHGMQEIGRAHV